MITLFINTAYKRLVIGLVKDEYILFSHDELISTDLSSKIMMIIDNGFKKSNLQPNDIDNIMIVNGPGSFTGVRVGVTIAKVYGWGLDKKIIPLSSLECLASTPFETKYVIPLIDARRDYVYGAVYDNELNAILNDTYIKYGEIRIMYDDVTFVSDDEFMDAIKPEIDIIKIVRKHINNEGVTAHSLNPNYLKKTEAEEKLQYDNKNK